MPPRLEVAKTYKLFIDGKFPRSESGRTIALNGAGGEVLAHVCRASRKDVRDAVTAARGGLGKWKGATAYNRGQVMYRMAEMLEGKRDEFAGAMSATKLKSKGARGKSAATPEVEVQAAIDRLVHYAGWCDKFAQILGCNNAVAGPYYNFTVPEATGVVAVIGPDEPGLLGLVTLLAPVICSGNTAVVVSGESAAAQLCTVILGEVMATSDVPAGVVNLLTGLREELVPVIASHRDIDAVHAAGVSAEQGRVLREGAAENVKRVALRDLGTEMYFDDAACQSPWMIESFVEMKTIWHPSAT
jgi:acyl-CoA reductase-like NAD-dependent aldehyde dehydrogenase